MSNHSNHPQNLLEGFTIRGLWYPSDKYDLRCNGTLEFAPRYGARLVLESRTDDLHESYISHKPFWGISEDRQRITLSDFPTRYHSLFDASENQPRKDANVRFGEATNLYTYHFRQVFLGQHFGRPADQQLRTIQIEFSHLNEWIHGIRNEPLASIMDLEGSRPMLSLPKVIEGVKSFTLEGNNSILINAESQGISLEEYYDVIYYVQNFLRLLILDPIFPSRVSATTLRSNCPVEIYFPQLGSRDPQYGAILPDYSLFTYDEVRNRFEKLLMNFLHLDKLISDLFFGYLYSPLTFIETRFLSLTQAIEAFHRKTRGGEYVTRQWYDENLYGYFANMINEAPKIENNTGFKASLLARMRFGYEYALRKRLEQLLDEFGGKFLDIFVYREQDNTQKQKKARRDNFIKEISSKILKTPGIFISISMRIQRPTYSKAVSSGKSVKNLRYSSLLCC